MLHPSMDEGRKRTILIAASILLARKLGDMDAQPTPALEGAIADAITLAERILQTVDIRFRLAPPDQHMTSSAGYPRKSK